MLALFLPLLVPLACRGGPDESPEELLLAGNRRMSAAVLDVVADEQRASRARAILDDLHAAERDHVDTMSDVRVDLRGLVSRSAPRDEMEDQLALAHLSRDALRKAIVAAYGQLRDMLEEDEWQHLVVGVRRGGGALGGAELR